MVIEFENVNKNEVECFSCEKTFNPQWTYGPQNMDMKHCFCPYCGQRGYEKGTYQWGTSVGLLMTYSPLG